MPAHTLEVTKRMKKNAWNRTNNRKVVHDVTKQSNTQTNYFELKYFDYQNFCRILIFLLPDWPKKINVNVCNN